MIRVRNLIAKYGDTVVLDNISLDVYPREILVIMGQSGCGKTTLLRHMIGLQRPASGSIEMGVLFQSGALFNSMTVGDNVAFPLREHTRLAEPVIRIIVRLKLEQVGLQGVENLMPSELSGGMKKRAGLARALALDPDTLFLDEPTTGLDPIIAAGIDNLILELRDFYKATMVVVAHDIASSMRIASRIAIFRDNKLIELGTPAQIQASPDPYVQQFLTRTADHEKRDEDLADYLTSEAPSTTES
jgi:phospholipid/cholesterol/gamma-HCH transport system ATP-binding protein